MVVELSAALALTRAMRALLFEVTPGGPDQLRHLARAIGWCCGVGQLYPRSPRNQDRSARRVALRMSAKMVLARSRLLRKIAGGHATPESLLY